MQSKQLYIKTILDLERQQAELAGWQFFARYYDKIPAIVHSAGNHSLDVMYEDVSSDGSVVLTTALACDEPVELEPLFSQLAEITNAHAHYRQSEAGTQRFYLDRVERLDLHHLVVAYADFARKRSTIAINGQPTTIDPDLLRNVISEISMLSEGLCAPSQGDYHERNIFCNGYIIDFEAAGWNLVSTDIATFVWHTLFAGSYFGPQYADWSTSADKLAFAAEPSKQLNYEHGDISLQPSRARVELLDSFSSAFVDKIDLQKADRRQISVAIAFRLLSMFKPAEMSVADRHMVFGLANYFFEPTRGFDEAFARLRIERR
jgi:hypothetical protein